MPTLAASGRLLALAAQDTDTGDLVGSLARRVDIDSRQGIQYPILPPKRKIDGSANGLGGLG
jgi:hypothetical protein